MTKKFKLSDDSVVVVIGSGAGGGTVANELIIEPNITTSCSRHGVSTDDKRPAPSASTATGVMSERDFSSSGRSNGAFHRPINVSFSSLSR